MAGETKKKRDWRGFAFGAVFGGLGAVVGAMAARGAGPAVLQDAFSTLRALTAWDLLVLPVLWLVAVGVHEGGHLAAGMARGMRFLMFGVGPIGLVRAGGRLRWRTYMNLGALAGFAVALPDPDRPLRPQMATLVAGGPLASLVLAIVAAAAVPVLDGRFAAWALLLAAISALLFLATAIPLKAGGFLSDGMQFVRMLREPGFLRRRTHLISLMGLAIAGTRPRLLDAELLDRARAETGAEPMYDIAAWIYSYHHALDSGDVAAASGWLERIEPVVHQYPDGFRQSLQIELALFEALHRRRADVAATWLASAKGGVVDARRRALAHAALASIRGDHAEAARQLALAERHVPHALDPGLGLMSRDQIAAMRDALPLAAP